MSPPPQTTKKKRKRSSRTSKKRKKKRKRTTTTSSRQAPPPEHVSPASAELVAVCLGGNSPTTRSLLLDALQALSSVLTIDRTASLYRTVAVSPIPQPDYLNTALLARTDLAPDELLAVAKAIERRAGRAAGPRYGPRPLDIDIVLWGERQVGRPELALPHPRLRERAFFLAPLAEIAPDLAVPPDGARVADLLARVDRSGIERVGRMV